MPEKAPAKRAEPAGKEPSKVAGARILLCSMFGALGGFVSGFSRVNSYRILIPSISNDKVVDRYIELGILGDILGGAVAVVAIAGTGSSSALKRCFRPASDRGWSPGEIRFGHWVGTSTDLGAESVVVTPLSDDSFEVHCHGGPAATGRILEDLKTLGVTTVSSDQWASHASEPLLITEATEVLIACQTARTAAVALDQVLLGEDRDVLRHEVFDQVDPRSVLSILASLQEGIIALDGKMIFFVFVIRIFGVESQASAGGAFHGR